MRIRRIVFAIDASPGSVAALGAAAELAAALEAELLGLFVEDINLIRWSSLPFARQFGTLSPVSRPLASGEIERQLRLQATEARKVLDAMAQRLGVRTSFRVARGSVVDQLIGDLAAGDLLSLGVRGYLAGQRRGLGSTARRVAVSARGRILLLPPDARPTGPAAVVFTGTPASFDALEIALAIVRGRAADVHVICVAPSGHETANLARDAAQRLGPAADGVHFRDLAAESIPGVGAVARSLAASTLILPREGALVSEEALERIAGEFPGCVLIV